MSDYTFFGLDEGARLIGHVQVDEEVLRFGAPAWGLTEITHQLSLPAGRTVSIAGLSNVAGIVDFASSYDFHPARSRDGLVIPNAQIGSYDISVLVEDVETWLPRRWDKVTLTVTDPRTMAVPGRDHVGLPAWGWADSADIYALPVDASGAVIRPEGGARHRVIHASNAGMDYAAIASHAGEASVDLAWVVAHPVYGSTPELALHHDIALAVYREVTIGQAQSTHLLLRRGDTFPQIFTWMRDGVMCSGESPLHPMYIGPYGTGAKPVITQPGFEAINLSNCGGNIVVQDLALKQNCFIGGFGRYKRNVMLDGLDLSHGVIGAQGTPYATPDMIGVTVRRCRIVDHWSEKTLEKVHADDKAAVEAGTLTLEEARWATRNGGGQGLFVTGCSGLLIEANFIDHIGWHPQYRRDGSDRGLHQPPNAYDHCIYIQAGCRDVTLSDNLLMRGASFGAMLRGSGYVRDNAFVGNNIGLNCLAGDYGGFISSPQSDGYRYNGQYGYLHGNLITHAGNRRPLGDFGAMAWGIEVKGSGNYLSGNIVAHHVDPNNPSTHPDFPTWPSSRINPVFAGALGYDDTVVHDWPTGGQPAEAGTTGLDAAAMAAATIQTYVGGAGDEALDNLRSRVDAQGVGPVLTGLLAHMRSAFGVALPTHPGTAQALRFDPHPLADALRWDTPENWSGGYEPAEGDTVDLGRGAVLFNRRTCRVAGLTSAGVLRCCGGLLSAESASLMDVEMAGAGQLVLSAGTIAGDLTLTSGRITGGAIDLTGRTLTLCPRDGYGAPALRGGTITLGGCAVVVDVTGWTGTSLTVPIDGMTGALGQVRLVGATEGTVSLRQEPGQLELERVSTP